MSVISLTQNPPDPSTDLYCSSLTVDTTISAQDMTIAGSLTVENSDLSPLGYFDFGNCRLKSAGIGAYSILAVQDGGVPESWTADFATLPVANNVSSRYRIGMPGNFTINAGDTFMIRLLNFDFLNGATTSFVSPVLPQPIGAFPNQVPSDLPRLTFSLSEPPNNPGETLWVFIYNNTVAAINVPNGSFLFFDVLFILS